MRVRRHTCSIGLNACRLSLLRRPPYYELDQAHHLEGRWEGFRSMDLERRANLVAFNRGRAGQCERAHICV